jgi:hypothetical protein
MYKTEVKCILDLVNNRPLGRPTQGLDDDQHTPFICQVNAHSYVSTNIK